MLARSAVQTRMAGLGSEGQRRAKEGQSHSIMVVLCGGRRIVLQRVLVDTDVLVVYEHLRAEWSVSGP